MTPPPWRTATIVGVGLIGGSLALDLKHRGLVERVVGVGRRQASLRKARQRGLIDEGTTRLDRGVAAAELVIVCTPVGRVADDVLAAAAHAPPGVLITDVGSIKGEIVAAVEAALPRTAAFVGSHPMAGGERAGPEHAQRDLFAERLAIVTPTRRTPAAAVEQVELLWRRLGARVLRMSPAAHDEAVAAVSHLPHVVAAALAAATPAQRLALAATGWSDTTRIAAGDVELWRQILRGNRDHTLKALDKFAKVLSSFRTALERCDDAALARLLEAGKRHRDAVGN